MTTIVYDPKTRLLACDSRMCIGTSIGTDKCDKFVERNGVLFVFAGAVSDMELLVEMYFNPDMMADHLEVDAIIVDSGTVYITEFSHKKLVLVPCDFPAAIGSGMYWALAALDFGCDVKGAIAYAKKKDSATGGRVRVFKV